MLGRGTRQQQAGLVGQLSGHLRNQHRFQEGAGKLCTVTEAQVSRLGSTRFQNHPRVLETPTWRFRKFYHKVPELPIRVLEPVALGFQTHTPWHSAVLEPCPGAQRQRFRKDKCSDSRSMDPSAPPLA